MFRLVFLLLVSLSALSVGQQSYDNYQVWRLRVDDSTLQRTAVSSLVDYFELDVWSASVDYLDVLVSHPLAEKLHAATLFMGLSKQVLIEDVQQRINVEREQRSLKRQDKGTSRADIALDEYHTIEEINVYLAQLEVDNEMVSLQSIATSYEGRSINQVKLSTNQTADREAIWIDCGIHAREWVSPASCIYGLDYLTTGYGQIQEVTALLEQYDVYIIPVLNVDGYAFTFEGDRLWRKNRSPVESDCVGVDLNRNYDGGDWGGLGSSNKPCSYTYHGVTAFSEHETMGVRDTVAHIQSTTNIKAFFSIHSYGQLWLYPFGYSEELPAEADELDRVSTAGVDAIFSVNGKTYVNGPHFTTIYGATGVSVDWGYSVGIIHSYIVELRDKGAYGFLLPENQILDTATELWAGLLAAIEAI